MPPKLRQQRLAAQHLRRQHRVEKQSRPKGKQKHQDNGFSTRAGAPQVQPPRDLKQMLDLRSWRQKAPERQSPAAVRKG